MSSELELSEADVDDAEVEFSTGSSSLEIVDAEEADAEAEAEALLSVFAKSSELELTEADGAEVEVGVEALFPPQAARPSINTNAQHDRTITGDFLIGPLLPNVCKSSSLYSAKRQKRRGSPVVKQL